MNDGKSSPVKSSRASEHAPGPCASSPVKSRRASEHAPGPLSAPPALVDLTSAITSAPPAARKPNRLELDKLDIARSKQVIGTGREDWIAFTSSEASWIPFNVDPRIVSTFAERDDLLLRKDERAAKDWLARAENVLHEWIVRALTANEKHPGQFRSLGRGWILIQLSAQHLHASKSCKSSYGAYDRKYTRFKWWFESVERVLRNRRDEFPDMNITTQEQLSRWTSGYVHGAELIFVLRGIYPKAQVLSCKKWCSDWIKSTKGDVWGTSDDLIKAIDAPVLSDTQRESHAKHADAEAAKRRAKRDRQKAKKAAAAAEMSEQSAADTAARELEEGRKASQAFDALLDEMRQQQLDPRP